MKIGISITAALGKENTLPGVADKLLADVYVDLVQKTAEIASRLDLKVIELVCFPPFNASILHDKAGELIETLRGFEATIHLPAWEINPGALNEKVRQASLEEQKEIIDIAASLGVKQLGMHPASFGAMRWAYGWFIKQMQEQTKKSIVEIQAYCQEKNMQLNIENLPFDSLYFTQPEHFKDYLTNKIGLVLDTSHAITAGINPTDFFKQYLDFVHEIHVVDGFKGKSDAHYTLGEGEVNFKEFFDELKKNKFAGPVILELLTEEDTIKSLEYLREIKAI